MTTATVSASDLGRSYALRNEQADVEEYLKAAQDTSKEALWAWFVYGIGSVDQSLIEVAVAQLLESGVMSSGKIWDDEGALLSPHETMDLPAVKEWLNGYVEALAEMTEAEIERRIAEERPDIEDLQELARSKGICDDVAEALTAAERTFGGVFRCTPTSFGFCAWDDKRQAWWTPPERQRTERQAINDRNRDVALAAFERLTGHPDSWAFFNEGAQESSAESYLQRLLNAYNG